MAQDKSASQLVGLIGSWKTVPDYWAVLKWNWIEKERVKENETDWKWTGETKEQKSQSDQR